ncbi:MAG: right-handed parallel beta-helix repeat-containing protein [Nitrososphaerota archaeon]|nr:right-handed parallel beta-helix repeat-containing protein [Candidatus Calditenuaceae archaeon]MDW8073902.1 right-handed parallel beta-helix repeat-containing protein [Nitrososphaerota archaeon]
MGAAKRLAVFALLLTITLSALAAQIPRASGATFTVTNLNDSGPGSLRQAISDANNSPGIDRIEFDPALAGTITLESPLPQITEAVIIDGSTAGGPITLDGSTYSVAQAFTITVWWGGTEITSLRLRGFTEYGIIVSQGLDEVLIQDLEISECAFGGILVIRYGWGSSSFNVRVESSSIRDNGGVGIVIRASGVTVTDSEIYRNGGAGILITVDGVDFSITGPTITGSRIYDNGAEGVLITGEVSGSIIGRDNVIERNRSGGITMASGDAGAPTRNVVESNTIRFNDYQDVVLVGEGVQYNEVVGNYITSDETRISSLGIIVRDGPDYNIIENNIVSNHRFEGIAIIGPETDNNVVRNNRVGAFDENGNPTGAVLDGNGAGILVGNDAAPDVNYPFPVYGSARSGPRQTIIEGNWVLLNRGAGIILIRATDVAASGNIVQENMLWGYYWVGSTGVAVNSDVIGNGLDGFRLEPYYGASASPDPPGPNDDVLPNIVSWSGTNILDNGGYAIRFVDFRRPIRYTPPAQVSGNALGYVGHFWLGYGQVLDESSNPVSGRTIELLRNDGDGVADYVWGASDAQGRYGPLGFNYNDISTWELIIEYEMDEDGGTRFYNPYRFRLDGADRDEIYFWDGRYPDPPDESGGAIESPLDTGVYRYQFVLLEVRLPRLVGGEIEQARPVEAGGRLSGDSRNPALFAVLVSLALAATLALLFMMRRG